MEPTPRRRGRPVTTGTTPKRYLRVGDLWDEATTLAHERGETMTALVIRALEREVRRLKNAKRPEG